MNQTATVVVLFAVGALVHKVWTWAEWSTTGKSGLKTYWNERKPHIIMATLSDIVILPLYLEGLLTGALSLGVDIGVAPRLAIVAGFFADAIGKKTIGAFIRKQTGA